MTDDIHIRHDLRPGDLGLVTWLHGQYYSREHGYNHVFEAYVADSLGEFGKQYDPARDRLWIAERNGQAVGSIGLVAREGNQAQLRWLLVMSEAQGAGLGRRLLTECVGFARRSGCDGIHLWTVHPLAAAARLYELAGFGLTAELPPATRWGPALREQRYDLRL